MFKKVLLSAAALFALCVPLSVSGSVSRETGAALRVVLDGKVIAREKNQPEADATYVPLRVVCEKLGAAVSWNEVKREAKVSARGGTHTVSGVISNGRLMVKAETVADILGLNALYESSLNTVSFSYGENLSGAQLRDVISSSPQYSGEDVYWLSRIVEAEAKGENYDSRLAVANVVLNRKESGMYPETVKEVIFDRKHGLQFTPVANGAVYNNPSDLSLLAALDALDGFNNVPGALFFMDPRQAQTLWIEDNRAMAFIVGAHTYYY